ncbi:MAG: hypothetical protein M9948_13935 [Lentimicrobium sp.]|nr:hypothetical protein [Lentimicrobium sp.]
MATINGLLTSFAQQDLVLGYSSAERDKINSSLNQLQKVLTDKLYNQASSVLTFAHILETLFFKKT